VRLAYKPLRSAYTSPLSIAVRPVRGGGRRGVGLWTYRSPGSGLVKLFFQDVVPLVGHLAHGIEEILEFLVVEPGKPPQGTNVDLVFLSVDRKGSVACREKRQLEQAAVKGLAARERHGHHRSEEQEHAVIVEHVDPHVSGTLANLGVARVVESLEFCSRALAETLDIGINHRARIRESLSRGAVGVNGGAGTMRLGHGALLGRSCRRARPAYGSGSARGVELNEKQDTSAPVRRLSLAAILLAVAFCVAACGGHRTGPPEGGVDDAAQVTRAQALVDGGPLGDRATVVALAQSVEAQAIREGAGERATELHSLAARLLERMWRIEGRDQDATEAIELYHAASQGLTLRGACESAVRGARLSGELARDGSKTYAELYRVQRRLAATQSASQGARDGAAPSGSDGVGCAGGVEDWLVALAPFRPPARVLESIDEGLAGEGAIALAMADSGAVSPNAPQIQRIDTWPGRESARVVVALSRAARFRTGDEPGLSGAPPRTFVELDGVDVGAALRDTALVGIVTRVRAQPTTTGARVTLDLDGQAFRRVFYLPEPYRVVIDIARHPPGTGLGHGRRAVQRVVLDPGHGGNDPGAIGPAGTKEKDVTLDIAHRAAPILAKEGMMVVLSRDDDRFVTLEERTARANGFGADLFVSIHCNAAEGHARHGVETYVLDTTKDEIAARVAARENATSQAATAELGSILASMRLADQASRSSRLAELMQKAALASLHDAYPDVLDGGVHTAGFYVLVGARMPSILFETSYISNPTEEQRLATEDYRQRLGDGIANAVRAYREGR
jgi:N-acetylmuramoyl-L-alanine amidase